MSTAKQTKKPTAPARSKKADAFSAEEKTAMRERARELKRGSKVEGEAALLARIAEMPEPDRTLAARLHAVIQAHAPDLTPRTWYGMPAYARAGKVLCFFQSAHKFKTRYATLGFTEEARLDEGSMWPVAFALTEWNAATEKTIVELIKRAMK